mmetsp:Transcript_49417/g.145963  ORF Transcript_49417/g.145963 Transcript_49417/m.145963 type:complete len:269 (-) Transcript_49417:1319-2125(-)
MSVGSDFVFSVRNLPAVCSYIIYTQESPGSRSLIFSLGQPWARFHLLHIMRCVRRSLGAMPGVEARWAKRPPPMWHRPCQVAAPGIAAIRGAATTSGSWLRRVHFITPPSPMEMCSSSPVGAMERCGRPTAWRGTRISPAGSQVSAWSSRSMSTTLGSPTKRTAARRSLPTRAAAATSREPPPLGRRAPAASAHCQRPPSGRPAHSARAPLCVVRRRPCSWKVAPSTSPRCWTPWSLKDRASSPSAAPLAWTIAPKCARSRATTCPAL